MADSTDPIRQQLIQARRDQILDAATQVFAEQGFHHSTTKDIANAAGIAEGTIYNYFARKDDLLIGMMMRLAELPMLNEELAESLHGDVRSFFITMFTRRVEHMLAAEKTLQAILPEVIADSELRELYYRQFVHRVAESLEPYVQARMERGDLRPLDAEMVTRVVQSIFLGVLMLHIMGDELVASRRQELPELLATIIFDGLKAGEEA